MKMKWCPGCGDEPGHHAPLDEFNGHKKRRDGKQPYCKRHAKVSRLKRIQADPVLFWAKSAHWEARKRALKRGTKMELTVEQIIALLTPTCPGCGVRYELYGGSNRRTSPSIDEVVHGKGYVEGNVWVLCYRCNSMKNDANAAALFKLADAVSKKEIEAHGFGL